MSRIHIKNFGPIKEIEFNINENYSVVIGEQATGKSTLAKCIYYFKDVISEFDDILLRQTLKIKEMDSKQILGLYYKNARKKFLLSLGKYNLNKDSEIIYWYDDIRYARILIKAGRCFFRYDKKTENDVLEFLSDGLKYCGDESGIGALFKKMSFFAFFINTLFGKYRRRIFIPSCRSIFVDSDNTMLFKNSSDVYKQIMIGNIIEYKAFEDSCNNYDVIDAYKKKDDPLCDIEERIQLLELLKRKVLKGSYKYVKDKAWIKLNNKDFIPLEYGSSGQQEAVWMLNILTRVFKEGRSVFLVIEEPEAHLCPNAQLDLVRLIALVINTTNSEVLITTHSPYILNSFNLLTYAGRVEGNREGGVVERLLRINPTRIEAYKIKRGMCEKIFDEKETLIRAEEIDNVSIYINEKFDELLTIDFEKGNGVLGM